MKWSTYQESIFNAVANPQIGSFVVNAVAGSGKTTTIVEAAFREAQKGLKVLFLAFNKSAVDSIIRKVMERNNGTMPYNLQCSTLHSHGRTAIAKYFGKGRFLQVENAKWSKYIKENISILSGMDFGEDEMAQFTFVSNIGNLLDKCRINLVKGGETRKIADLAEHFGIDLIGDEVSVVSNLLATAYRVNSVIDFADMITTSVFSCAKYVPKYDLIFVDEAQDLNKAQQTLLMATLAPNGRFVAVGDPKQAINGFAGADCESFANLKRLANNQEYPLSVCYRCGKKIVELAQTLVPSIMAFDGAEDGEIRHSSDMVGISKGDMVLCRKTAPLVGMCLKLIANGIPSNVLGRDMASGIKTLITSTKAKTLDKLFEKLYHQIDLAIARAQRKGLDPTTTASVVSLQDKVACIEAVSENCTSVNAILSRIDDMFIDRDANAQGDANKAKNIVTLSTIHKAKGLESDKVWIIAPEKLPLQFEGQKDWEYEQELNLCYVAYTRAKKVLTFVDIRERELGGVAVA